MRKIEIKKTLGTNCGLLHSPVESISRVNEPLDRNLQLFPATKPFWPAESFNLSINGLGQQEQKTWSIVDKMPPLKNEMK